MTFDVRWAGLAEEYPAKIVWMAEMSLRVIVDALAGFVVGDFVEGMVFVFFAGGSFSTRGEVFFDGGMPTGCVAKLLYLTKHVNSKFVC